MKFERRRVHKNQGPWLPIVGTGLLAYIKRNHPNRYERLLAGEVINYHPYYEYRLRKEEA